MVTIDHLCNDFLMI